MTVHRSWLVARSIAVRRAYSMVRFGFVSIFFYFSKLINFLNNFNIFFSSRSGHLLDRLSDRVSDQPR